MLLCGSQHVSMLPMSGDLAVLFGASLLGSAHCVGMCGPYVAMCTAQFVPRGATPARRFSLRLMFNFGRIATYCLIGLGVGAFGSIALALAERMGVSGLVALMAGIGAGVFGLSLIGWFRDPARIVARLGVSRLLLAGRVRLKSTSPMVAPLLLGSLQGWLPCALVYAAASRAAMAGSPTMGAITMGVFGLGTVPAIFALTLVPRALLRPVTAQRLAGVLFVLLGCLLVLRGLDSFGLVPASRWW